MPPPALPVPLPMFILAISLWLARKKATKRPQKVVQVAFVIVLNIILCSLDVNISVVRITASNKGQEQCLSMEMRCITQRVQFVASRLLIFVALLRTMNR